MRFLLALCIAAFVSLASPAAHAFTVDCKDTSALGAFSEGIDRQKGMARLIWYKLTGNNTSDAYRLIATGNGAMMTLWQGLMCQATAVGDPTAVQLRNQWSGILGDSTDGFTIGRAYDYYMKRIKYSPKGSTNLLQPPELALIKATIAYMDTVGPQYVTAGNQLTAALGL